jgi:hypothetical protein
VHALVAPMLFLVMYQHSIGACEMAERIDPRRFIATQTDLVLNGLRGGARVNATAVLPPCPADAQTTLHLGAPTR